MANAIQLIIHTNFLLIIYFFFIIQYSIKPQRLINCQLTDYVIFLKLYLLSISNPGQWPCHKCSYTCTVNTGLCILAQLSMCLRGTCRMTQKTFFLHLLDLLWCCVIITPLTVLGWRGMWDLLDQVTSTANNFNLDRTFLCFRFSRMILNLPKFQTKCIQQKSPLGLL